MTRTPWLLALATAIAVIGWMSWRAARERRRREFIKGYRFGPHLRAEVLRTYPHLDAAALNDVERGMRQFFRVSLVAGGKMVAMPSKAIDELWHALILDTARYQHFCRHAFGRVLHHTPARVMRAQARGAEPLRRAWRLACQDEGLNPRHAVTLPLMFELDTALGIPDGFRYVPDCKTAGSGTWCGNALGCGSTGCGSSSSDSDSAGGGGGDGDAGGSCGGGGGD